MASSIITACSSQDYKMLKDGTFLSGFRTLYIQQSWKSYNLVNPGSDKHTSQLPQKTASSSELGLWVYAACYLT